MKLLPKEKQAIHDALERFYAEKHFDVIPSTLKLASEFAKTNLNMNSFSNLDILFIQHHLGPLVGQLNVMEKYGLEIENCWFVDIPYSTNHQVVDVITKLENNKNRRPSLFSDPLDSYSRRQLERVEYVLKAISQQKNSSKVLVMDDGGYFIRAIYALWKRDPQNAKKLLKRGIFLVEQTTKGHRYLIKGYYAPYLKKFEIPAVSIASSFTKEKVESNFIGAAIARDVVNTMKRHHRFQRHLGKVLILGYGRIGKATAKQIKRWDDKNSIDVFDADASKRKEIQKEGVKALDKFPSNGNYDTVFGCTGNASFGLDDTRILSNDANLISGSSAAVEFNREKFLERTYKSKGKDFFIIDPEKTRKQGIHATINIHKDGKEFSFLNAGFPINFDGRVDCLPHWIIQSTHTLMIAAANQVLHSSPGFSLINERDDQWIHDNWFRCIKHHLN